MQAEISGFTYLCNHWLTDCRDPLPDPARGVDISRHYPRARPLIKHLCVFKFFFFFFLITKKKGVLLQREKTQRG